MKKTATDSQVKKNRKNVVKRICNIEKRYSCNRSKMTH